MFKTIVLSILFSCAFGLEPQCSQFHYEEQLLEKMVRMEFSMQKMQDHIKQLENNANGFKNKSKIQQESLQNLTTELRTTTAKLAADTTQLSADTRKLSADLGTNKHDLNKPRITFKARTLQTQTPVQDVAVVFNTTLFDTKGAYNNATGIFTAPVDGIYLFTSQICMTKNYYVYIALAKENEIFSLGRFQDEKRISCYTTDGLTMLKTGERVWVKFMSSGSKSYSAENEAWNTFSGVLISS